MTQTNEAREEWLGYYINSDPPIPGTEQEWQILMRLFLYYAYKPRNFDIPNFRSVIKTHKKQAEKLSKIFDLCAQIHAISGFTGRRIGYKCGRDWFIAIAKEVTKDKYLFVSTPQNNYADSLEADLQNLQKLENPFNCEANPVLHEFIKEAILAVKFSPQLKQKEWKYFLDSYVDTLKPKAKAIAPKKKAPPKGLIAD